MGWAARRVMGLFAEASRLWRSRAAISLVLPPALLCPAGAFEVRQKATRLGGDVGNQLSCSRGRLLPTVPGNASRAAGCVDMHACIPALLSDASHDRVDVRL